MEMALPGVRSFSCLVARRLKISGHQRDCRCVGIYRAITLSVRCYMPSVQNTDTEHKSKQIQCDIWDAEADRQMSLIPRMEKIEVSYTGPHEKCTLIMNKDISTPFNCAQHISDQVARRACLALVDGEPWDLGRPLARSCTLAFTDCGDAADPRVANLAFWRTASFLLGYCASRVLGEGVDLHSWPPGDVSSGSFVYDVAVDEETVHLATSTRDLRHRMADLVTSRRLDEDAWINTLDVSEAVAKEILAGSRFKADQIPSIAAKNEGVVRLYRFEDHIDISRGPLVSGLHHFKTFTVAAIHPIETDFGRLYRIQGLAYPHPLQLHHWTYCKLTERAAKLNTKVPFPRKSKTRRSSDSVAE